MVQCGCFYSIPLQLGVFVWNVYSCWWWFCRLSTSSFSSVYCSICVCLGGFDGSFFLLALFSILYPRFVVNGVRKSTISIVVNEREIVRYEIHLKRWLSFILILNNTNYTYLSEYVRILIANNGNASRKKCVVCSAFYLKLATLIDACAQRHKRNTNLFFEFGIGVFFLHRFYFFTTSIYLLHNKCRCACLLTYYVWKMSAEGCMWN